MKEDQQLEGEACWMHDSEGEAEITSKCKSVWMKKKIDMTELSQKMKWDENGVSRSKLKSIIAYYYDEGNGPYIAAACRILRGLILWTPQSSTQVQPLCSLGFPCLFPFLILIPILYLLHNTAFSLLSHSLIYNINLKPRNCYKMGTPINWLTYLLFVGMQDIFYKNTITQT